MTSSNARRISDIPPDARPRTTMLPPPPDETEERSGLVRAATTRRDDADDVLAWLDEALAHETPLDGDEEDDRPTIPIPTPVPSPLPARD